MLQDSSMDYAALFRLIEQLPRLAAAEGEPAALVKLEASLSDVAEYRSRLSAADDVDEMWRFRRALLPLLLQSEFGHYCFTKPRGYPGDFVTQEMIWIGRTCGGAHRYRGNSELGRLLTSLTFDMAAPAANESRVHRLRSRLAMQWPRVASIGCGSCIELWDPGEGFGSSLLLVDQDAGALDRARERLTVPPDKVTFCHENVLKCILRNQRQHQLGQQDFIYAFGLLDYFPPPTAKRIVSALWDSVAPGGVLLVTNAHPGNPTKVWMEYVGDWFLNYKTGDQCLALSDDLPGLAERDLTIDDVGVYQYLELRRQ